MAQISIKNEERYEANIEDFEFIRRFEALLKLAIKVCDKRKIEYGKTLDNSWFVVNPDYYWDFGQDNPIVNVDIYVDDDLYVEYSGSLERHERAIGEIFYGIKPRTMGESLTVRLCAKSLLGEAETNWRINPQYNIGGGTESIDQDTI